jgi:hypothetical protein
VILSSGVVATSGVLLLINAAWNFFVWPPFLFRRVLKDERARDAEGRATTFLRVHVGLILVAALLGIISLVFGLLLLLTGTPTVA